MGRETEFSFRFVPSGTVAPEILTENEVWLDVGNRANSRVLDHHGGDTEAHSASELVLHQFDRLVQPYISVNKEIILVSHTTPDLDAICAIWLIQKTINGMLTANIGTVVEQIVQIVSENDQGLVQTNQLETCWPIIFRQRLGTEIPRLETDVDRVDLGIHLLEQTLDTLLKGESLADASMRLITAPVESNLSKAYDDYLSDVSSGNLFQLYLPFHNPPVKIEKKPQNSPSKTDTKWGIADGLFLNHPRSALFKELARGDTERSSLGKGFSFMIVAFDTKQQHGNQLLRRYIISTNPRMGFHLQGLGKMLESEEQTKELQSGESLLPGRERVGTGNGRHGYNVASP